MKTKQGKPEIARTQINEQRNENASFLNKRNEGSLNKGSETSFRSTNNKKPWKKLNSQNLSNKNTNKKQGFKSKFNKLPQEKSFTQLGDAKEIKTSTMKRKKFRGDKLNFIKSNDNRENENNLETRATIKISQNDKFTAEKDKKTGKTPRRSRDTVDINVKQHEKVLNFENLKTKKRFFYRTVLVGNLPSNVEKEQLLKLFSRYGKILHVVLKKSKSKTTLLQSFIVFQKRQDALKVLEDNNIKYKGHDLQIQICDSSKYDANKAIVVSNLSADTESNDLWTTFESCGPILNVHLIQGKKKIATGTGYVNFESASSVEMAMKMENVVIKSSMVTIKEQKASENKSKKKRRQNKKKHSAS